MGWGKLLGEIFVELATEGVDYLRARRAANAERKRRRDFERAMDSLRKAAADGEEWAKKHGDPEYIRRNL
jgi:hypothetical protein